MAIALSLLPPDPSDWAAKAAQWAQQRQIQEQYFQQLTQWQQQMAPQEQAPPPEQVPNLGQPIQPLISSAQPQPQAIFQQQQYVTQAQPATLNMNVPHHQIEPQQAPPSHHTQPVVHQQEEERRKFDHLPRGEKFQGEPPQQQQQQEFHPRGNFGHHPTFRPKGGSEFHFRGPHGDGPPRPRGQHVFESRERAPSPHHWEKAERPPRVGNERDFGAAQRSDNRRPLPPTEEMFRGKHGIKGFHPMQEFESGGSPMHGFEQLEGGGDDEFVEHQTMEGYRDGRMKSRWESEEQDEQYEEQSGGYKEQHGQYEQHSEQYEECSERYEQRGEQYPHRGERYEQQGEQYERGERYEQQGEQYECGERYEQQGEQYERGERYEQQGEQYERGERYEQQDEQYEDHGERYKERRQRYVHQEGQYSERKEEDGYRSKPELRQFKQEVSQHDTEGEWLYGHQEQGQQRGSEAHFDRSRGKHLYQDETQYRRDQTGRSFGRDQEPFVRQEIKREPNEGLQFGRMPVKSEATLSSLRKETAFIPGLGGFEKEETASPMAPHAQSQTKEETKAATQTLSNNPTNQMIESLGKIVSQLQTLQGLTSSLQLLQALPKGQQEAVKAAAERMRETDGGGGGRGGGGQQTERELSEETKRKVAALLASESDSDGEQVYCIHM